MKRTLLTPYIWVMRFQHRHATDFIKALLENTNYSPDVFRFINAMVVDPDKLHEAPNLNSESVVFDVGGFDGDWSARVFEKYRPNIYCFEAHPEFSKNIAERFQATPKVHVLEYGLTDRNGTLPLSANEMATTLYVDQREARKPAGETLHATVRDIVEAMDALAPKGIDLIKLNIEGGEYDLLERMIAADRLRDVACFNIQFHEWFDGAAARRRRIQKALRRTHHQTWGYDWCWEQWVRN